MFRYRQLVNKIPWRVVGGVAVATPVVAMAQGSYLLYDYRRNHGNAPVPNMPSQGLVIADHINRKTKLSEISLASTLESTTQSTPPIKTSTPSSSSPLRLLVIGDSLAAGVGTSQSSTPVLPHSIAVHLSSALEGRAVVWTCVGVPGQSAASLVQEIDALATTTTDVLMERWSEWRERQQMALQQTKEWWEERKIDRKEIEEIEAPNRVVRWWKRISKQAKDDAESLKRIVRTAIVDGNDSIEKRPQTRRKVLRRTTTRCEPEMGNYDVAVVLTGLNDLKESYLPFMMQRHETSNSSSTLREQLVNILKALESKMRTILPNNTATTQSGSGPLVVFPALPYEPTILNRLAPLSWFLIPLLRTVDRKKQDLADLHPHRVLYVEAPDTETLSNAENKDKKVTIPVLLQLNDIRVDVQERIEQVMWQYYGKPKEDTPVEDDSWDGDGVDPVCHSRQSIVVSADGIHPSDRGYEAWGEHIARKIVEEWEHNKNSTKQ